MPFGALNALPLHFAENGPEPREVFPSWGIPEGRLDMFSSTSRDEALNRAAVISIVFACLVSATAIGMSFWTLMSKLL